MSRIGSCNNHVTILVTDDLWLQSEEDDIVDWKLKASEVRSHLYTSFAGARLLIDALTARDTNRALEIINAFDDTSHVGKLKIMRDSFEGVLSPLWGYPPGRVC